jgi:predicted nucleic acid-binding protein
MTSSIDTNVLVALLDERYNVKSAAKDLIGAARALGGLLICGCVFAELMAGPRRTEADIEGRLRHERILVDWNMGEAVWRLAGERYKQHCARRRERGSPEDGTRRILTDFIIGSHAVVNGCEMVTFDQRLYAAAFPELRLFGRAAGVPPL